MFILIFFSEYSRMFSEDLCFFFFKQKTAYEMRISDWSSDVCSSDLCGTPHRPAATGPKQRSGNPRATNYRRKDCKVTGRSSDGRDRRWRRRERTSQRERSKEQTFFQNVNGSARGTNRSEENTSALQSIKRTSYAVCFLKKKKD